MTLEIDRGNAAVPGRFVNTTWKSFSHISALSRPRIQESPAEFEHFRWPAENLEVRTNSTPKPFRISLATQVPNSKIYTHVLLRSLRHVNRKLEKVSMVLGFRKN
jgi:hypothetical protein